MIRARKVEDAAIAVQTDAAIGCMVVDWGKRGLEGKTAALVNLMRKRGLEMPIVVMVRRKRLEDIPVEVVDFIDGYIFLAEETPDFIARGLVSRVRQYADTLKTPFFGALVDYAEQGNQLWTCPGHNGGVFYNRSPIGRIFVEHLGEAIFRDDIDNSVLELGDLLVHEGPALQRAARGGRHLRRRADLFRAERHLGVEQGRAECARGRGRPLCSSTATTTRPHCTARCSSARASRSSCRRTATAYGLIGPIFSEAFDEERRSASASATHPLVTDPGRLAQARGRSASP